MNARAFRLVCILLAASCGLLVWPREARATLCGPNPAGTQFDLDVSGFSAAGPLQWAIGTLAQPTQIGLDATAGAWVKTLVDSPLAVLGTTWNLEEIVQVQAGSPDLTDWHMNLLTDGFNFVNGSVSVNGQTAASGQLNSSATGMDYIFNQALTAGTTLVLDYSLQWNGTAGLDTWLGGLPGIQIGQVPSGGGEAVVPEPPTGALLGAGLTMLGLLLAAARRARPWRLT